jgi:hypothetical protein
MVNWLHILIDSKAARAAHCSFKIVDGKKQPPDGPFKVGGCINLAADQIVILDIFRQALGFAVRLWNTPDVTKRIPDRFSRFHTHTALQANCIPRSLPCLLSHQARYVLSSAQTLLADFHLPQ